MHLMKTKPFTYLKEVYASSDITKTKLVFDSKGNIIEEESYSIHECTNDGEWKNCYLDKDNYFSAFDFINKPNQYEFKYIIIYKGFVLKFKIIKGKKVKAKYSSVVNLYDFALNDIVINELLNPYLLEELVISNKEGEIVKDYDCFFNVPRSIPLSFINSKYHNNIIFKYDHETNLLFYRFQYSKRFDESLKNNIIKPSDKKEFFEDRLAFEQQYFPDELDSDYCGLYYPISNWMSISVKEPSENVVKNYHKMLGVNKPHDILSYDFFAKNTGIPTIQAKYLFFDTETTGLYKPDGPSPYLVQLAWAVYDHNGDIDYDKSRIIKPDDFVIPYEAEKVHRISNKRAQSEGIDIKLVLYEFLEDIMALKYIVAHNIEYDVRIINNEIDRNKLEDQGFYHKEMGDIEPPFNSLPYKEQICTMKSTIDYCKIEGNKGYKYPSLSELYHILFHEEIINAHDALVDLKATARCFFELKRKGMIQF